MSEPISPSISPAISPSQPTTRPLPSLDTELESFRQQWRTEVAFARAGGSRSTAGVAGIPVSASTSSSYPLGTIPQPTSLQRRQKSPPTSPRAAPTTSRRRLSAVSRSPERKLHDYLPTSIGSPSSSPRSTTSSLLSPPQQPHVALPPLPAGVDPTNEPPQSALAVYQQAIDAEHASQLNEAIRLYQRAFRLNDQVDKDYAHFVAQSTDQAYETPPLDDGQGSTDEGQKDEDDLVFRFQRQYHLGPDYSPTPTPHASSTNLHSSLIYGGAAVRSSIINSSDPVVFDQADETEPCFLQGVPDEVLVVVLAKLGEGGDVGGIGRFAQTCKKAFLLSLEQGVWKHLCLLAYQPPYTVPRSTTLPSLLAQHQTPSFRTLFLAHPRVRFDGVFISVVHYVRVGASETLWNDPVHMVTYHRLIRFLPNGQVMSLLSTEHPSTLVPLLDERLRMKGLHHGRWELVVEPSLSSNALEGGAILGPAVVQIVDLGEPDDLPAEDDPVHPSAKVFKRDKKRKPRERKYDFEMSLSLGSTSRGRWNKLTMGEYVSFNRATGEVLPIKLVNQGPFYFSKVRSYSPFQTPTLPSPPPHPPV